MHHDTTFVDDLGLDPDQTSVADADRDQRSHDWGTAREDGVRPDVVVWPESTADVASVMRAATEHGVPVTPYAAGTSLEGNAIPIDGGITLDMTRMDAVLDVRPDDLQVDIQPGILGDDVNEAVAKHGLFLPSMPASGKISTIGGMLANDASGMKTVKYGEVSDWVLGMEVVLPTGEVITTGSRAVKTSSGYDLGDVVVGSEGTLGVITRVTIKLAGRPAQIRGGRAHFETLDDAAEAVFDAVRSGVDVAKIELIDRLSAAMSNAHLDTDLPDVPMVFVEFHANHGIEAEIEFCRSVFEAHDVTSFEVAENDRGMDELWAARRELAEALEPYEDHLSPLTPGDVTVPISEYPGIIRYAKELAEAEDFLIPCFGHAGDGNLHYAVMVDKDDPDHVARGADVSRKIVERAIELGGTSTGEHGIGLGKQDYLVAEHGEAAVDAMRSIKRALDPAGIMNPGKVFDGPDA
ncbi:FAD-binding oxidoreductase [Haloplanus salinus]|jgi:D-lactate dehydrogenase (cytochrome)|uniref:D-lactate dehydrogenase (cytochrome) n=1 Tax=Haloplanus salinus TaxID=1126245 RepID=A0A368N8A9_9EURY|nr:FAD-binding oxidoreductase [Haloplanus salinus]RCU46273.1 FAD-binding oxidoreductase [Haloplanus salinus]